MSSLNPSFVDVSRPRRFVKPVKRDDMLDDEKEIEKAIREVASFEASFTKGTPKETVSHKKRKDAPQDEVSQTKYENLKKAFNGFTRENQALFDENIRLKVENKRLRLQTNFAKDSYVLLSDQLVMLKYALYQ
jgi:predicted RNase H-like nuclease (RuvC/YqgF family)